MADQFAIGIDYGTNSVRSLVVNVTTGAELVAAVYEYPSGDAGILLDPSDPNVARQNPADYIEGFLVTLREAIGQATRINGFAAERVVGIGIDTTGSTPLPVDADGTPLACQEGFRDNPDAHAWLWKDHTSHAEAAEITRLAVGRNEPYLAKCGGIYSSEWYWAKIAHCMRVAPEVAAAAAGWIELADFVPGFATGTASPDRCARNICAAGHKAMYSEAWGGLPSKDFLDTVEPGLGRFRYETRAVPSDRTAGHLTEAIATKVGLPPGVPVAVGALDAHMGAVGAGARDGTLVKIIGTSTCDCLTAPLEEDLPDIPGLCGIVPESILPGSYGIEAGQSAVGDIFNWFATQLAPASAHGEGESVHAVLTEEASKIAPGASGLVALDWNNGNRTVLVDPLLSGLLVGQTLHTTAAEVYRAMIEATAFGALTIIQRIEDHGVRVHDVINCGGIADKNPLVMQVYADVCNRPMKISRSTQTCAVGAAIFAAVVGNAYPTVREAQASMTGVKELVYEPIAANAAVYAELYQVYRRLHDAFGSPGWSGSLHSVMKDLIRIRARVRAA